jgi:alpha-ribazole phosphatase/probable phosphoglycerate mutase
MQRAYKCGALIANQNRVPMYIDKRLRECNYGDFTQAPKSDIDAQKPDRIDTPFKNGESYQDCMKRMGDFLQWLKDNFDGKTVMIVGHRATQYGLEHHIKGKDILTCVSEPWAYQPGWHYELV